MSLRSGSRSQRPSRESGRVLELLARRRALVTWGSDQCISGKCYPEGKEGKEMLIDTYQPEDVFARVPELAAQIDPVLRALDVLLEDDQLYQQVRADLGKRYRFTLVHVRHSTPVEVLLRMLLCKHLYQWSFKETEERVKDSLVLRWFCRVYFARVPDETTLLRWLRMLLCKHLYQWSFKETEERVKDSLVLRWFCRVYFARVPDETTLLRWLRTLRPQTLHALNDRVVQLAVQAKATKGRKLRLDATCVQTTIHHPTDSGLLVDSVRVLSRLVKRAKTFVKDQVSYLEQTCRSRLRSARTTAQRLHRQLRRKGEEKEAEQKVLYQKLIETAEQMVRQATRMVAALGQQTESEAKRLFTEAEAVLLLVKRVITQTRSRVLEGKKVASLLSLLQLMTLVGLIIYLPLFLQGV